MRRSSMSLLATAAAALAPACSTSSLAADLPIAEPVEYVRICDAFGTGFYYIPGTETCLRVSGRVRVETHYVDGPDNDEVVDDEDFNNWTTRARGYLRADARAQTAFGLVRAYIDWKVTVGPSDFSDNYSSSSVGTDHAFIQITNDWGLFTAGVQDSFFDAPFASNTFGVRVGIDDPTTSNTTRGTLFAYTRSFGDFSTSVSAEDPASNGRRDEGPLDDYEGQEMPDLVGNVRYDAGWGAAMLAGVVGQIHDNDPGGDGDGVGWAVNAGFNASFGWLGAGLTAGYADGRIAYITTDPGGAGDFDGPEGDDTNTAWAIRGGLSADITPTLTAYVDGSWTTVDTDSGLNDYDYWAVAADLQWTPVSGLMIGPEIAYTSLDPAFDDNNTDEWGVMLRVQRDF